MDLHRQTFDIIQERTSLFLDQNHQVTIINNSDVMKLDEEIHKKLRLSINVSEGGYYSIFN